MWWQNVIIGQRKAMQSALRDLGTLTEKHILEAADVLGKGAGLKEVLSNVYF